jgi:hypothetical protein
MIYLTPSELAALDNEDSIRRYIYISRTAYAINRILIDYRSLAMDGDKGLFIDHDYLRKKVESIFGSDRATPIWAIDIVVKGYRKRGWDVEHFTDRARLTTFVNHLIFRPQKDAVITSS